MVKEIEDKGSEG